jgi:uncharacterized protein (DUF2126 family)
MRIERVWEAPRVTKPYSDSQWAEIDALGLRVDADLEARDVRLTMGGEPTFVSIDDRDGGEWNTEALGPAKRTLAADLLKRLRDRYAPQGLLHFGQGKWYPGEQLPRWSLGCFWRKDGEPLWNDPTLLADERAPQGADAAQADRFLRAFAERLGLDPQCVFPAYEDVWYYLWRERRLPANVDPFDSRLADPLERERLRRIYMHGLDRVAGYVFPCSASRRARGRAGGGSCATSAATWSRAIPLGAAAAARFAAWVARRLADGARAGSDAAVLPMPSARLRPAASATGAGAERARRLRVRRRITRTAICAEPRNGVLYSSCRRSALEDYLELVAAVEATAADSRSRWCSKATSRRATRGCRALRITPDPACSKSTSTRREAGASSSTHRVPLRAGARARLSTEKFMLDGRHTGTGGGNHSCSAARRRRFAVPAPARPAREPARLLAQPSVAVVPVLGHVHRPDQPASARSTRRATIRSTRLEIALQRAETHAPAVAAWLVDRLFRNLLIDATGNTHRAEFCIDKLYRPTAERPPRPAGAARVRDAAARPHVAHAAVAAARARRALLDDAVPAGAPQALGDRAARSLHAAVVRLAGLGDVIEELDDAGYPLRLEWFAPHFEFRFPRTGDFARARRRVRTAYGARTVARNGRGRRAGRHRALRRFVPRAAAGESDRIDQRAPRTYVQRPRGAAAAHRQHR